jgi:tetratricopeptide (TPR) repeat protein
MILDNFQTLLEPKGSDAIFKQGGFEELFKSLFSPGRRIETLICTSSFPGYLSGEPWNVSALPLGGIEFNDMPAFCEQSPQASEFLGKLDADGRSQFYQVFGGDPTLLKLFELWEAKKGWYEALKSHAEPDKERGNLSSFSLLFEKVPPEVKKLLSLLVKMNREIILDPLLSAFDAKKEGKIEGFSRAKKMGFLHIIKGRGGLSPDRVEVASIIGAYYSENPQDLDIFKREHQFHLKQYGKSAVELGRKWIEEEEKENGFRLMLSAWDCLFAAGEFSDASALLQEISQPLLDMCLFEATRCMYGALIDRIQDDREKIVILRQMGKILAAEGMTEEMEANYQKCLEINRSQVNRAEVASDLYELGAIQIRRGFYDKGLEYLQESLKIRTDMDLEGGKADSLEKIAAIYAAKKEYSKTVDLYSQVLKIRTSCKDYPGVSTVLRHLSEVYHKLDDYTRSMETDTRKVEIDKKCNNPDEMVRTLLHMTDLQIEMERYEEGITLLDKCMTLEKQLDDQLGIASALLKKSEIKRRQGQLDEAMLYCRQSLQANEQLEHRFGLAANYNQLSFIYHDQKEPEEAIKYAAKSLDLFNEISDKENVVTAALHLGDIYQQMSDFDSALIHYRQALEIKRDEEEMGAMAAIQNLIANLHYLKGDAGLALESYGQSLSILKHLNRVPKIAEALHHMATIHQEQGNLSEATELYQQSLVLNKELENLNGIALSLGQVGRILEQEGKHCKAVGKFAASLAIFRHLKSEYEELATQDLTNLKNQLPDMEYKWCVTAGLEEHAPYLENVEVEGKDF